MPPLPSEDRCADSQERLKLVFERHHAALSAEAVGFENWSAAWADRQNEIDCSLVKLKQKILRRADEGSRGQELLEPVQPLLEDVHARRK